VIETPASDAQRRLRSTQQRRRDRSARSNSCRQRSASDFSSVDAVAFERESASNFSAALFLAEFRAEVAAAEFRFRNGACGAMSCREQTRRSLLLAALATGTCLAAAPSPADDQQDPPGSDERPQKGDVLVVSDGELAGAVIKPSDLKPGGPPLNAWPKDPKTSVIRKGSRLNEILIIRLDPAELDDNTKSRSADGIVAYSVICTHAGCPVSEWVKAEEGDKHVFKCPCHNSEFNPRESAQVVFGPAPRRLAALPLEITNGSLTVAAPFIGKVGAQQG
jgi:rieske iron-sulfur protein